jgi:CRISPR/Cas system CMR subunit Cmr6 (Cas7 group RAMP superfamily)
VSPNELRRTSLPLRVESALQSFNPPRHPQLAQGMVFGQWRKPRKDDEGTEHRSVLKGDETSDQSRNLRAHFQGAVSLLQCLAQRQIASAAVEGMTVVSLEATTLDRLLVGTGLPNQLETGFLLHPLYGVPYLPGSAIKGATQSFLLAGWGAEAGIGRLSYSGTRKRTAPSVPPLLAFERLLFAGAVSGGAWRQTLREVHASLLTAGALAAQIDSLNEWASGNGQAKARLYVDLFGSPAARYLSDDPEPEAHPAYRGSIRSVDPRPDGRAVLTHSGSRGNVSYFDAIPMTLHFESALQTPHALPFNTAAQKRLQGDANVEVPAPDDHFDPVPLVYPVVGKGSTFLITVSSKEADLAGAVRGAVGAALRQDGIGAKRGIGFGRFEVNPV